MRLITLAEMLLQTSVVVLCCSGISVILMGRGGGAGCFAWFVSPVSRGGWVALPCSALGFSAFVIVVFPDHTHLLLFIDSLLVEILSFTPP